MKIVQEQEKVFNPTPKIREIILQEYLEDFDKYSEEGSYFDDLNTSAHFEREIEDRVSEYHKNKMNFLEGLNLRSDYITLKKLELLNQKQKDQLFYWDTRIRILNAFKVAVKKQQELINEETLMLPRSSSCTVPLEPGKVLLTMDSDPVLRLLYLAIKDKPSLTTKQGEKAHYPVLIINDRPVTPIKAILTPPNERRYAYTNLFYNGKQHEEFNKLPKRKPKVTQNELVLFYFYGQIHNEIQSFAQIAEEFKMATQLEAIKYFTKDYGLSGDKFYHRLGDFQNGKVHLRKDREVVEGAIKLLQNQGCPKGVKEANKDLLSLIQEG
ncbi:hypothetical protein [Adhaeribacter radiodurans]|uniref:Uncharacterized protein n=1 Tax=Adhaeribacter radiodurans TaxID=2745197 RepID=A0A7L7L7N0_9BACT|nr:hypothetical protein [Adhaeribacter radiodurans]QMU28773.1 hypothetical protein HUW48_12330 [Adhaeribacter radiodurans]